MIIRIDKQKSIPFVVLQKNCVADPNLSWQAKGLHTYLMTLPNDWKINVNDLKNRSTNGRDSTTSALNELIKANYIIKEQVRDNGKFGGFDYTVYEVPYPGKPFTGNPELLNNNNTNINNKLLIGKETSSSLSGVDLEYLEIIERVALNTKVFTHRLNKSKPSKTLILSTSILKDIKSGRFKKYIFKEDWIEKQSIDLTRIDGITTLQQLEKLLRKSILRFKKLKTDPEYIGTKNVFKNTTFPDFLYNERTGVSMFLKCLCHAPKKSRDVQNSQRLVSTLKSLEKSTPNFKELSLKIYNNNIISKWNESDQLIYYSTINQLIEWHSDYKDIYRTLSDGWGTHFGKLSSMFGTISRFLDINAYKPRPNFLEEGGWLWDEFVYWCRDYIGVELKRPKQKRSKK